MQIIIVRNYKDIYPELKGKDLTDRLVLDLLGEEARVTRSEAGKPSIVWDMDDDPPFVSVSHSGDVFACAFDEDNLGIDIQSRRKVDIGSISRRYYTAGEQRYVGTDPVRFYEVWTRKEAFAKYTGLGLAQVTSHEDVLERQDVRFEDIDVPDDYSLSICISAGTEEKDYEIQFLD